jgi:hypothetical protein
MAYRKTVKGDNNEANEQFAHNSISIFNDGSGKIVVCFLIVLVCAMIVYLWIAVHVLLVIIIIGAAIIFSVIGVSYTWRHVSHTRKLHRVNEAEVEWAKIIYITENLIAHLDRSGNVNIHNARDIQEVRHFNDRPQTVISDIAASKQQSPDSIDAFSQTLNRNTNNGYNR